MFDNLVGSCDITHENILVNEEHYIVLPLIGNNTNLQFKLSVSRDKIRTFCQSIYQNIPFTIEKTINPDAIKLNELTLFINNLKSLSLKYEMIYNYPIVLNKVLKLLQKKILTLEEKDFITDMEDAGILYKQSTNNRFILEESIALVQKQKPDYLFRSRQRTGVCILIGAVSYCFSSRS